MSRLITPIPAKNPQGSEGVPSAGLAVAILQDEVNLARMRVLQEPAAVGLPLGSEQLDGLLYARVWVIA